MSSFQEWCPSWWWWFWQQIQRQVKEEEEEGKKERRVYSLLSLKSWDWLCLLFSQLVFPSQEMAERDVYKKRTGDSRMNFTAESRLSCLLFNFFLWVLQFLSLRTGHLLLSLLSSLFSARKTDWQSKERRQGQQVSFSCQDLVFRFLLRLIQLFCTPADSCGRHRTGIDFSLQDQKKLWFKRKEKKTGPSFVSNFSWAAGCLSFGTQQVK